MSAQLATADSRHAGVTTGAIASESSPVDWTPRSISLTRRYTYKGDRLTDPALRDRRCRAVLDRRGKCIRGTLATMLVLFDGELTPRVIMKRCLRKLAPTPD